MGKFMTRIDTIQYTENYIPPQEREDIPLQPYSPPAVEDTETSYKKEVEKPGFFTNMIDWFYSVFFSSAAEKVKTSPSDEDMNVSPSMTRHKPVMEKPDEVGALQMQKHLRDSSELIHNIKDINDDGHDHIRKARSIFDSTGELGLDRAWIKAQIDQIGIRQDQIALTQEQMLKLHELLTELTRQISEKWKERNKSNEKSRLFGKIDIGTSAFLIATAVVIAGLSLTGIGAAGALVLIAGAVSVVNGGTKIYNAVLEHEQKEFSAEILGMREKREFDQGDYELMIKEIKAAYDSVHTMWTQAKESEDNKANAARNR
jgi:hypothetical protein